MGNGLGIVANYIADAMREREPGEVVRVTVERVQINEHSEFATEIGRVETHENGAIRWGHTGTRTLR